MDIWVWIGLALLVIVVSAAAAARRTVRGRVDPTQLLLDPDLVGRVRGLARSDQKIAAIRLLRAGTPGLGLGAARVMVDRMAAGAPGGPATAPTPGADLMPSPSRVSLDVELQARSLKSAGEAMKAVELIRERTDFGLQEATDYVDRL